MRITTVARRSVALTAATALVSGGLAAGFSSPAHAAAAVITSVSPSGWDNRSSVTLTIKGSGFSASDTVILHPTCSDDPTATIPSGAPCAPLTGHEVGDLRYPADAFLPGDPALTAQADLSMAPPGRYSVLVQHNSDMTVSSPAPTLFKIFAYGPATTTSTVAGVGTTGVDPLGADCTAEFTVSGCGRNGPLPLDVKGANFAIGAKVQFLNSNGTVDTGLPFTPGNPSNDDNVRGTDPDNNTAYPSSAVLQGDYDTVLDGAGVRTFTPGWHDVRVVNTDGQVASTPVRQLFAQPYFNKTGALSFPADLSDTNPTPTSGIGQGAKNKLLRITGQGFRAGSTLYVQRKSSGSCGDLTIGQSTLGGQQADGLFTTITAPITFADCTSPNNDPRTVGVVGPEGGRFFRTGLLTINPAPTFTGFSDSQFQKLGQGAHVGFGGTADSNGILVIGTGFQGVGEPDTDAGRAHMTSFDFGPGVTVTTRKINPTGASAFVSIDVSRNAGTGERTARVTNPDGASTVRDCDRLPNGTCDPSGTFPNPPLVVQAGPTITGVQVAGDSPTTGMTPGQSSPTKYAVAGTNFQSTGYSGNQFVIALPGELTQDPNVSLLGVSRTSATALTFQAQALAGAVQGIRDVIIENDDHGRFVCAGCVGIDTLAVTPTSASANSTPTLSLTVLAAGLPALTPGSTVTLTHQTPAPGQPPIVGTGTTASDTTHGTSSFNLTGAASGPYNVTVVLDPNGTQKQASCVGCFTVTGTAFTLDGTAPVTPNNGGQGATNRQLTFKGTGFTHGMDVTIPDVTVHDVTFVSSTEMTALVDIAPDAPTGAKTGTVTGGDGSTKTFTFTVNPAPKITSVSPTALGAGAGSIGSPDDVTSTASGASKLAFEALGSGYQTSPVTQIDLGPATAVLDEVVTFQPEVCPIPGVPLLCTPAGPDKDDGHVGIGQTAATGPRNVTVVNGDGGVGTLPNGFTVNPGPKITSIANANGQPFLCRPPATGCANPQHITVLGANFPTGAAADPQKSFTLKMANGSDASGITMSNIQFAPGQITADVTVASGQAFGPLLAAVYNVTDKGFGSCSTCLTVANAPSAPGSLTLTPGAGTLTATWAQPAGNGGTITTYHTTIQRVGSSTVVTKDVPGNTRTVLFDHLVNGATYVVKVQGVNVAGAGPFATKSGIPGLVTALTGKVSATVVTAASGVTISGTLKHGTIGVPARTIRLTIDPYVGATFTRTVTTTSTGAWSYRYYPRYHFAVRPTFTGDATYRSAIGPLLKVTVPARVTRTSPASGTHSSSSTTLTIKGTVFPNHPGVYVYLYRFTSSGKQLISRVKLSSTSTFTFTGRPGRGTYTFRVYIPATTGNSANYSSAFTLYRY